MTLFSFSEVWPGLYTWKWGCFLCASLFIRLHVQNRTPIFSLWPSSQYLLVFCCVGHLKLSSPGVEGGCVGLVGVGWSLIEQKMGLSLEDGVMEQPHQDRKLD